jgi:hypothetical protein
MTRIRLAALSTDSAYRVPWRFERDGGHYTLRNLGNESLRAVSFALYGSGLMPATAPATLEPGDDLEIVIAGAQLERNTIGVVRWFRPNGDEYLWRVSF